MDKDRSTKPQSYYDIEDSFENSKNYWTKVIKADFAADFAAAVCPNEKYDPDTASMIGVIKGSMPNAISGKDKAAGEKQSTSSNNST